MNYMRILPCLSKILGILHKNNLIKIVSWHFKWILFACRVYNKDKLKMSLGFSDSYERGIIKQN